MIIERFFILHPWFFHITEKRGDHPLEIPLQLINIYQINLLKLPASDSPLLYFHHQHL